MRLFMQGGLAALSLVIALSAATSVEAQTAKKSKAAAAAASPADPTPAPDGEPVPAAAAAPVPAGDTAAGTTQVAFQTMDQLQKGGVKRCLQLAQAVGRATMVGTTEYAAASTWNSTQPDSRFSVSMIGQKFGKDPSAAAGLSGVFSTPTQDGKCDAAAIQIIPTGEPCSKAQDLIVRKGKVLGDLAGVQILQNAANAQVMLVPGPNNSCVLVALSTVYMQ